MKKYMTVYITAILISMISFALVMDRTVVYAELKEEEWILPKAEQRLYKKRELRNMTPQVQCYARNEIYARHGMIFDSEELKEYFELQSWYYGTVKSEDFAEELLNGYETGNLELLAELEKEAGKEVYELDLDNYSFDEIDRFISSRKNEPKEEFSGIAEDLYYDEDVRTLQTACLKLNIPKEWDEHFGVSNPTEDILEFYCTLAYQQDSVYDGVLCDICRSDEEMTDELSSDFIYLGECNGFSYYWVYPSEERYDPEDSEGATLYKEMAEVLEEMADSIQLIP